MENAKFTWKTRDEQYGEPKNYILFNKCEAPV